MATNQSTTFAVEGESEHAVDGVLELDYSKQSCIQTQVQSSPWWMVDLGGTFQIEVVIISNRYDCCEEKLTQIELSIGRYTE